jgi:hypothetical protein
VVAYHRRIIEMKNLNLKTAVATVCLIFLLSACSQGPDFTKNIEISKKVTVNGVSTYYGKDSANGVRGIGLGEVKFKAFPDFAETGETIDLQSKLGR